VKESAAKMKSNKALSAIRVIARHVCEICVGVWGRRLAAMPVELRPFAEK